jgi:UDP-N-acetyl-D-galactosamine dehydrogenase
MSDKICIIGLGYVGLPLAIAFAENHSVTGFDIVRERVDELSSGFDRTLEVESELLESVKESLSYTTDIEKIKNCNVFIITVPTPIDQSNRPDLTPLIKSSETVSKALKKDDLVIYESTVYPGVTEDVCVPILAKGSGLIFNKDFFVGYSPERINPGDKHHTVKNILKVTSGSTPEVAKRVDGLYQSIITAGTHLTSSIKVAEASKVIENTQRDVNIALINELALIFDQMGIDTNEVIEAAATKWNFIKLSPGLVGGHCIGVDPYYLTFKAEELGYKPNLILSSRQINNSMSKYIAEKTIKIMILAGKKIKDAKVLIMGVTFKEDCPDMRNSKVMDVFQELQDYGTDAEVYDPWAEPDELNEYYPNSVAADPLVSGTKYDAIIAAVGHSQFKEWTQSDYEKISSEEPIIIDVKNVVPNPTWRL